MSETTIAGLARAGGVGVETVRYYQRRGLLATPERPETGSRGGGVRRYGEADLRRLRFIRGAQAAGFTLEEIRALIALAATDDRPRARALAAERIAALDARIAELTASRDALHRLAQACREEDACAAGDAGAEGDTCAGSDAARGPCPILTAFEAA